MISTSNISLRVGKKALFEDVNIKFTEGNCYGLIGANGAGKSTFLRILSGQLEPTSGLILYDFTDVLDRMHLPFPLTTRYLHPEVSHKNK